MERVTWYMSNISIFYGFYVEKILIQEIVIFRLWAYYQKEVTKIQVVNCITETFL